MKNKFVLLLIILAFSMGFVNLVKGTVSNSSYTTIPQVSPTPTLDPNATVTPTPSPTPISTVIYVEPNAVQSINPNGAALTFSPYNQTIVNLAYAECMNSSLQVSADNPNWYENRNPTGITFFANDIGTFNLHFQVLYSQVVNQSITLSIKSGDGTVTILPIASVNQGFTLDVVIHTLVLPQYPSASDIANAQYGMQKKMLQDVTQGQQNTNRFTLTVLAIVVAVVAIIGIVLVLVVKYIKKMAVRHLRSETYGYNYRG